MNRCVLCDSDYTTSEFVICHDPQWENNCWGGGSHSVLGSVCLECIVYRVPREKWPKELRKQVVSRMDYPPAEPPEPDDPPMRRLPDDPEQIKRIANDPNYYDG